SYASRRTQSSLANARGAIEEGRHAGRIARAVLRDGCSERDGLAGYRHVVRGRDGRRSAGGSVEDPDALDKTEVLIRSDDSLRTVVGIDGVNAAWGSAGADGPHKDRAVLGDLDAVQSGVRAKRRDEGLVACLRINPEHAPRVMIRCTSGIADNKV